VFAYLAHKLGSSKNAIIALLVLQPVMHEVLNGNINLLVALGVVFPLGSGC
jgi:hypothetical protein